MNAIGAWCSERAHLTLCRLAFARVWQQLFADVERRKSKALASERAHFVGFKIMYGQGVVRHRERFVAMLAASNIRVIHLMRRNKLRRYISNLANNHDRKSGEHIPHPKSQSEIEQLRTYRPRLNVTEMLAELVR